MLAAISPVFFIVGGVAWVAALVFVVCVCMTAGDLDEPTGKWVWSEDEGQFDFEWERAA